MRAMDTIRRDFMKFAGFAPGITASFVIKLLCKSHNRQHQPDNSSFRWQRKQRCNTPQVFGAYCKNGPGSVQTNAFRAVESNQENYCTVSARDVVCCSDPDVAVTVTVVDAG